VLAIVDDFSRECLALVAATSLSGLRVTRELTLTMARRGRPKTIVSDNETELTSVAVPRWSQGTRIDWHYIAPGKPLQNAFVESFGVPVAEVVEVTSTEDGIKLNKVWVACDVGKVMDPVNFENLVQGGVIFGLGHAMNCEITYSDGMAEQENYDTHAGMRLNQCPEIFVKGLENAPDIRGIGEPPVPPAAPALANAIFAATGKRIRELPLNRHIDFV
jgi:CO/xanthine dehydrogenase Mo-binding subunit